MGADAGVRPGEIIAGKYRVERVLGAGAMGVVVAALHVDLQERRAIKFMLPSMLEDGEGVERFLREARSAVRLKSVHVAKIHDIGRLENGAPYMVMELLEGQDVKHALEARGALPVHEAVGWMLQVCEAMAEAHQLGIVHRDLKPANLYLTRGATGTTCVKVLDFGIAKLIGSADDGVDMTRTSTLLGTPLYMSPEQMRGARNVDGRSDLWAMGAILYRMLTNRTPFAGSSVTEICAAVVADTPDPPAMLRPDLPRALEAAVMRCLEKNPANRFQSVAEFAAAIAPFATPHAAAQGAGYAPQPFALGAPGPQASNGAQVGAGSAAPQAGAASYATFGGASHAVAGTASQAIAAQTAGAAVQLPPGVRDAPIDGSLAPSASRAGVVAVAQPAPKRSNLPLLVGALVAVGAGIGIGVFLFTRTPPSPSSATTAARDTAVVAATGTPSTPVDVAPAASAAPAGAPVETASAAAPSASASGSAAPLASTAPAPTAPTPIAAGPNPAFAQPKPTVAPPPTQPTTKPTVSYDKRR